MSRGCPSVLAGLRARVAEHCLRRAASAARATAVERAASCNDGIAHDAALADGRPRPTSNWGLISARQSNRGAAHASAAGSTLATEMNETSITIRSGAYGESSAGASGAGVASARSRSRAGRCAAASRVRRRRRRHGGHVRRAVLEQAVREAAGRCADVRRKQRPETSTSSTSSALASLIPPRETYAGLQRRIDLDVDRGQAGRVSRLGGRSGPSSITSPARHRRGRAAARRTSPQLG